MRKPRVGQVFKDRDKYWHDVENMRAEGDNWRLPPWAFDFISVHPPYPNPINDGKKWTMCSPMKLVDPYSAKRPAFEDESHETKAACIKRARELARDHETFVVVCPGIPG